MFNFAKNIFLGGLLNFNNNEFLKYHREALNLFDSHHHALHKSLLQLMRLIEVGVAQPNFPNKHLLKWLSNSSNRKQFDKTLKEIDEAYKPLSLLYMIDQAPGFSVAVANKLFELENLIVSLKEENQSIKEENKQLRKFVQTEMGSIYQSRLPIFNNHVNTDLNIGAEEERTLDGTIRYPK